MRITKFEEIEAWLSARELAKLIYSAVADHKGFTSDFGLKDQITRALVSVMSNIAEGFNSGTNPEFIRFLGYAQRSCSEVQSQLYVALDQKYITSDKFTELYDLSTKTSSMIGGFIKYLRQSKTKN